MERTEYETARLSDAADDIDETSDIEVQRAEIDRTRTDMASTLDAIKDKLDPGALMDQAREKANEVMDHAKATVHEVTSDVVGQVKDVTSDVVGQVKEVPQATVDAAKRAVGGAVDSAKDAVRPAVQAAGRVGGNVVDTVKANPIPYALVGIGLAWLFMNARRNSNSLPIRYYQQGNTEYTGARDNDYTRAGVVHGHQPDEWHPDPYQGRPPAEQMGGVSGALGRVQGSVSSATGSVRDAAGNLTGKVQETASNLTGTVRDAAGNLTGKVQETAGNVASTVRSGAEQAADTFQSQLQNNPVAVGVVALGIGLAAGLLLPETDRERELMGDARARVGEKVQAVAQDLSQRVQSVAQDLGQKVQDVAKEAVDTVKEEASQGLGGQTASASTSTTF